MCLKNCPAKSEFLVAAKAIMAPGVAPNVFIAMTWVFAFAFLFLFTKLKRIFSRHYKDIYDYMTESRIHLWPHLFLFSKLVIIATYNHYTRGTNSIDTKLVSMFNSCSPAVLSTANNFLFTESFFHDDKILY